VRVLMLTDVYPPVIGGTELYVQRLSRELAGRGHDVSVVTLEPLGTARREVDHGVAVFRMRGLVQAWGGLHSDPKRPFAPPLPDPRLVWSLASLLREVSWDVVHAHNWLMHSYLPLRAWSRAPLVVTLHDYSLICAKKILMRDGAPCSGPGVAKCLECATEFFGAARGVPTVLGNWAMQLPTRLGVDLFLPVSQAVARGNRLAARKLPFRVIPNFLADHETIDDADPRLAQLPGDGFLLFVGGLDRSKGVDVLLRAYGGLSGAPPLVIIGASRPDDLPRLPPNVILLRDWPHPLVLRAWQMSVIGLVPSVWPEPFPTVTLEAMAAGRPVIASRVGGLPDQVVDGETGVLVPPGDPDALRRAIERLLADVALRERLGRAARRAVESFRARAVVPQIERTYAELVKATCQAA